MIHGFKGNKTTTAEEWLIDYSLRTSNVVDVNPDLISMSIKFDGKEVDAFILDMIDNKLVIHLALPLKCEFDGKSNRYETSYVRELINSNEFLSRFNPEFAKHVQQTTIHTEDYVTTDKLWLLSHEEISKVGFFIPNEYCRSFDLFKHVDLQSYSEMLLKLSKQQCFGWRLRSAYYDSRYYVGCVDDYGDLGIYNVASATFGAVAAACAIC